MIIRCCFALLSAVLVCIAIALTWNAPELTYSSDIVENEHDILVSCTDDTNDGSSERSGALADAPLLDTGEHLRPRFEIVRGEDVIDRITAELPAEDPDSMTVYRGINADCDAARTSRMSTATQILGGALLVALLALLTPTYLRLRSTTRTEP